MSFGDGEPITVDVDRDVGRAPPALRRTARPRAPAVEVDERGFVEVDAVDAARHGRRRVRASATSCATPQLAHVGFAEGMVAIKDILGEDPVPVDYGKVPWCIYCHPEVAFAGMSEEAAKEAGLDVVVSKHRFVGNGRALIIGETDGLVKVIAEKDADGKAGPDPRRAHGRPVGHRATRARATSPSTGKRRSTKSGQFIQPHPTLSEMFGETVLALTGRGLHG